MNVISIKSQTVKTYTVSIEDGEVRDCQFSSAGRRYQVVSATVTKRDGNVSSVALHGDVLKKDGTPGAQEATEHFYGQRGWPEWLRSIVGGLA